MIFCCTLFWYLSLNDRAFKEYISENAMLVGASSSRTRVEHVRALLDQAYSSQFSEFDDTISYLSETTGPFSCSFVPCPLCARKLSICVATSRGDGKDALLLVARTPSPKCTLGMNRASALEASLAKLVSEQASANGWLGRDVYVILVPCECSLSDSIANWLHAHHESPFDAHLPFAVSAPAFWAGMIVSIQHPSLELVNIQNIGNRGRLTNLDVVYAATWTIKNQGLAFDIERNPVALKALSIISVPKSSVKLSSFILSQARGTSSGAHGHLLDYQIEAVTLQAQSFAGAIATDQDWIQPPNVHKLHKFACSVELLLRTQSNVLERYHQSYFYYAISDLSCTSDGRGCYIPISHYLLVVGLFVLPLLMATFNLALQIVGCDWMLCWMTHGVAATLSVTLFHWFSHAVFNFYPEMSSMYMLALCSFSTLLAGSLIAAQTVAFAVRRIPHSSTKDFALGLDAVALVNAIATITHISISNGAQGLVAACILSPLVCFQLHCRFFPCKFALIPSAAESRHFFSTGIVSFFCGCSC